MLVVIARHLIAHYSSITITKFMEAFKEFLLVFLIVVFCKFLCAEDVVPFVTGIGLFHCAVGTKIGHIVLLERKQFCTYRIPMCQAFNLELMDTHLLVFIYDDGKIYHVFMVLVIFLIDFHVGILISFAVIIALDDCLRTVENVRSDLSAFCYSNLHIKVFSLAFLHAIVFYFSDSRTLSERNLYPAFVTVNLFEGNLDIAEKALTPETAHSGSNLISRHGNGLSD